VLSDYAGSLAAEDRRVLIVAAWLHDLGYAPTILRTGSHALDGAQFLEASGVDRRVVCLVAHHSAASFEAEERGLTYDLAAFERENGPVVDALTCADMTVGPQGTQVTFEERTARRYKADLARLAAGCKGATEQAGSEAHRALLTDLAVVVGHHIGWIGVDAGQSR
jgi:putative nucleotidyltransferase with HDIG domain